ncbi:MAG: DNA polymerase III subunit delta [Bacteroidales bacterium]|jgi:DNA polymerase III subunit delta'|nr:DNA polymerase III subunit delta [Bacteroidales bacterium]MDD3160945.1 DNA polymerase III subunit delta [Bacteroidales bacterium]
MFFKDIVGQQPVKDHLRKMVDENRLPHALLLHGNEGTGVFPLGLALARYLDCTHRVDGDACGVCPSCLKFNKLAHPDLHFVFPIYKDSKRKKERCDDYISEWRQMVLENPYFNMEMWLKSIKAENSQAIIYAQESDEVLRKLSFKTFEAEHKVMLIWLPEKMHSVCANKLLKILEEPAPQTHFILLSENPEEILGTILSRSQSLQIPEITQKCIADKLEADYKLSAEDAQYIAHIANGSYIQALNNLQMGESASELLDFFVKLMRLAYMREIKELKKWSEEMAAKGREYQKMFLDYTLYMMRENFMANFRKPSIVYMNSPERTFSSRFCQFIHERNIDDLTLELTKAADDIESNVNSKIVLFDLALKIATLLKRK